MATDTWPLTTEQQAAVDLFNEGGDLVIEAGAGAGKTATLVAIAKSTGRTGAYMAFNSALTKDAAKRMPSTVEARTVHSHAWQHVMRPNRAYQDRFRGGKRLSRTVEARILGVDRVEFDTPFGRKVFDASYVAGCVMAGVTRFCQSDDPAPTAKHFPTIDVLDSPTFTASGRISHRGPNNKRFAEAHVAAMRTAWADLVSPDGALRFTHDVYLKLWQLSDPSLPVDYVLFDEAQDASPVMRSIVLGQRAHGIQVVAVGDSAQAIYAFTGAVNAMADIRDAGGAYTQLTKSFRFGPAVADAANVVLDMLADRQEVDGDEPGTLRVKGHDPVPSQIGKVDEPDCVLTRTNAKAVEEALRFMDRGLAVSVAESLKKGMISFAEAAMELQHRGSTWHPELAPFSSWDEVQRFVNEDVAGSELALMVKLVDEFSPEVIIARLGLTVTERQADVVLSTAHTSKGREWGSVRLGSDFAQEDDEGEAPDLGQEELRLLYVAVTRAKLMLDLHEVPWLERIA